MEFQDTATTDIHLDLVFTSLHETYFSNNIGPRALHGPGRARTRHESFPRAGPVWLGNEACSKSKRGSVQPIPGWSNRHSSRAGHWPGSREGNALSQTRLGWQYLGTGSKMIGAGQLKNGGGWLVGVAAYFKEEVLHFRVAGGGSLGKAGHWWLNCTFWSRPCSQASKFSNTGLECAMPCAA